jgi:hypothetical protein
MCVVCHVLYKKNKLYSHDLFYLTIIVVLFYNMNPIIRYACISSDETLDDPDNFSSNKFNSSIIEKNFNKQNNDIG